MISLPIPSDAGLPQHFSSWRPSQRERVEEIVNKAQRFSLVNGPPGSGKTAVNLASALQLAGPQGRVLYLAPTKALSAQVLRDIESIGGVAIEGRKNYCACQGPCAYSNSRPKHCYANACLAARHAKIVVSNYAYWGYAGEKYIGKFDVVVADEAHNALHWLTKVSEVQVRRSQLLKNCGVTMPNNAEGLEAFAPLLANQLRSVWPTLPDRSAGQNYTLRTGTESKRLEDRSLGWCCQQDGEYVTWQAADAGRYAEEKFWHGARHVILSSATLPDNIDEWLHLEKPLRVELESGFDFSRRPIKYVDVEPVVDAKYPMEEWKAQRLAELVEYIAALYPGEKGYVYTHSNWLTRDLSEYLASDRYMIPEPGQLRSAVGNFEASEVGNKVIVSPGIKEGFDWLGPKARFAIIVKLPFPPLDDRLIKARRRMDSTYYDGLTRQSFVQVCGRGMRKPDDWCDVWMLDGQWKWFSGRGEWQRYIWDSVEVVKEIAR